MGAIMGKKATGCIKNLPTNYRCTRKDPYQMNNVASKADFAKIKKELSAKLERYLKKTGDPRVLGGKIIWDSQNYYLEGDFVGRPRKEAIEKFHLRREYHYMGK